MVERDIISRLRRFAEGEDDGICKRTYSLTVPDARSLLQAIDVLERARTGEYVARLEACEEYVKRHEECLTQYNLIGVKPRW